MMPLLESKSPGDGGSGFKFETDLSSALCDDSVAVDLTKAIAPVSKERKESPIEETKRELNTLTPQNKEEEEND